MMFAEAVLAAVLAAGAGALLCFLEGKRLTVRHYRTKKAPVALAGKRAAVFSDVHFSKFVTLGQFKRCVNKINAVSPDFVFFTGDLAGRNIDFYDKDFDNIVRLLKKISPRFGKFAVLGNNDYNEEGKIKADVPKMLEKGGFKVLNNENIKIGENCFIVGLSECKYNVPDYLKAFDKTSGGYCITLAHQPDMFLNTVKYGKGVQFSGHSHGGQICIPFLYKRMLPEYARVYSRGVHEKNGSALYITNGVGLHTLPFRFMAAADILSVDFTDE